MSPLSPGCGVRTEHLWEWCSPEVAELAAKRQKCFNSRVFLAAACDGVLEQFSATELESPVLWGRGCKGREDVPLAGGMERRGK